MVETSFLFISIHFYSFCQVPKQNMSAVFKALKDAMKPAAAPASTTEARRNISLEDLGLSVKDLKATAKLTPVLREEDQNLSEESIKLSNPQFDFSDHSIIEAKKFLNRNPHQIAKAKAHLAILQAKEADYTALLPSMDRILQIRREGRKRQSLSTLSYTPSPRNPRIPDVSLAKRRYLELDNISDDDENNASELLPEQLFNYADQDIYSNSNTSSLKNNSLTNNYNNNHSSNHRLIYTDNNNNQQSNNISPSNNNNNNLNRGSPSPPTYPQIKASRKL